jgi:NAD(P)-dependent dehydrogenase (short-subunit alcohol dehydrogenase family)
MAARRRIHSQVQVALILPGRQHRAAAAAAAAAAASSVQPPRRVCVVTGANKGIGQAIARSLALTPGVLCIATARSEQRGRAAVAELIAGGVPATSIAFRQLDLDSDDSIAAFVAWFRAAHDALGVLVNNAAIAFNSESTEPFAEQARPTISTNFLQTMSLTDRLAGLVQRGSRVVFIASGAGTAAFAACSEPMRARIVGASSRAQLRVLAAEFVERVEGGMPESGQAEWATTASHDPQSGFAPSCYGMSKCLLIRCACARGLVSSPSINSGGGGSSSDWVGMCV